MKTRLPLPSAAHLHELFVYKDGLLIWRESRKHGKVKAGAIAGWESKTDGYVRVCIEGMQYAAHRLIWRMHNPRGATPFILDHIDGDRSNNRIENLRKVTPTENIHNRRPRKQGVVGSGKLQQLLQERSKP
jgi:hypothetical protein